MDQVFQFFFGNYRRIVATLFLVVLMFGLANIDVLIDALSKLISWAFNVAVYILCIGIVIFAFKKILGFGGSGGGGKKK